jgi:predicted  nucleic acid-binding Zn-ribbon protein
MFFKKYKMEIEQLKQENDALKAQIAGISFNLRNADNMVQQQQRELETLNTQIKDLKNQITQLNLIIDSVNRNNESRYY